MAADDYLGICIDGPKIWEHVTSRNGTFMAPVMTDPGVVEYRHFFCSGVGFWTCNQQIRFLPVAPWTTNAMPAFPDVQEHFPHLEKLAMLIKDLRHGMCPSVSDCIDKVIRFHPDLSPMKDMAIELGVYEEGNGG